MLAIEIPTSVSIRQVLNSNFYIHDAIYILIFSVFLTADSINSAIQVWEGDEAEDVEDYF